MVDFNALTGEVREFVRSNPGKALLISVDRLCHRLLLRRVTTKTRSNAVETIVLRPIRAAAGGWTTMSP